MKVMEAAVIRVTAKELREACESCPNKDLGKRVYSKFLANRSIPDDMPIYVERTDLLSVLEGKPVRSVKVARVLPNSSEVEERIVKEIVTPPALTNPRKKEEK
jgi:hypothetical protein